MRGAFIALAALGCAARAPAELSAPFKLEPVVGMPRLCVPMLEAAGRFPKKEADAWRAAREALTASDGVRALAALDGVADHPAKQAVRAVAAMIDEVPDDVDLADAVAAWPADACLLQLAAVQSLQRGDRDAAEARVGAAVALTPDDPDVVLLATLIGASDPYAMAETMVAAADRFPEHAATQVVAGRAAVSVGDMHGAARVLGRAAALGVEDAEEAVFHLWRMTGELEPYLAKAVADGLPVSGADFPSTDLLPHYERWLGLDPDVEDDVVAVLRTSHGDLRCTLFHRAAPVTVINFVGLARGLQPWTDPETGELARRPLYDGTRFHRVIPGFMIQGGDPLGTGRGFPGYRFPDELAPGITFDEPGLLAMANSGADTNGSQFFITDAPTHHLDGRHTIFGRCDEPSLAVVRAIASVPVDDDDRPVDDVLLNSIGFEVVPCDSCIR